MQASYVDSGRYNKYINYYNTLRAVCKLCTLDLLSSDWVRHKPSQLFIYECNLCTFTEWGANAEIKIFMYPGTLKVYCSVSFWLRSNGSFHEFQISFSRWAPQRSTIGDRAFPVAASRVWNSLPSSVTSAPSLPIFRRLLKTELFARSYGTDQ